LRTGVPTHGQSFLCPWPTVAWASRPKSPLPNWEPLPKCRTESPSPLAPGQTPNSASPRASGRNQWTGRMAVRQWEITDATGSGTGALWQSCLSPLDRLRPHLSARKHFSCCFLSRLAQFVISSIDYCHCSASIVARVVQRFIHPPNPPCMHKNICCFIWGELFHSKYHSRLEEEEVKQTVNYSMKETNAVLLNEAAGFVSKSQYRMPPNFQLLCGFPKPAIHSKEFNGD
jgi:hypothetical protein